MDKNTIQVFSKEWFELHQTNILRLANTRLGKRFFGIGTDIPKGKKLLEMLPDNMTWADGDGSFSTDFRSGPQFAKRLYYGFKPLWWAMHGWDFMFGGLSQKLDFGFSTLTVNPAAGHASTTCDQDVRVHNQDSTLATIRAAAGDEYGWQNFGGLPQYGRDGNRAVVGLAGSGTSNQYAHMSRFLTTFDTSALTTGATISAAVLSVFGAATRANIGNPDLHCCASTPASAGDIVIADYSQVGSTSFGSIAFGSFSTSAYNAITLDANGIANISKTGISKFALRTNWDMNNSTSGISWSTDVSDLEFQTADGANAPKLVITYTVAVGPANVKTYNGVTSANTKTLEGVAIASVKTFDGIT